MTKTTNQFLNLAKHFESLNDWTSAQKYYQLYVAANPNHAAAYMWLANMYRRQKDFEKAIQYYKKALRLDPKYYPAVNNLLFVLKQVMAFDEIEKYKKMLPTGNESPFLSIITTDNPKRNLTAAKNMVNNEK